MQHDRRRIEVPLPWAHEAPWWGRRVMEECSGGLSPEFTHILAFVASELVTNAVVHARGPLMLTADFGTDSVCIAVRDGDPSMHGRRIDSRGLDMVRAMSREFGVRGDDQCKTVWARLSFPA